jgi:hypothetical protein
MTFKGKTKRKFTFYKVTANSILLYGSVNGVTKQKEVRRIYAVEVKFVGLHNAKGCTKINTIGGRNIKRLLIPFSRVPEKQIVNLLRNSTFYGTRISITVLTRDLH